LYVNISNFSFEERPVSEDMKEKFIGGRGFGLKLLWDAVKDTTKWNDPENEIVISGGPLCGITQYPGSGKCYTVFISPLTEQTYDSNAGGYFGPLLKFSGWDALEIQGKADRDIVVFIDGDNNRVEIYESPFEEVNAVTVTEALHEYFAEDEEDKRNISVVSTGKGAENSYWGCLNMSFYDLRRKTPRLKQAGRGGGGTVFRDKKLAAIVVKKRGIGPSSNNPADLTTLQRVGLKLHKEIRDLDDQQNKMRKVGTPHLNEIMNEYHLLPVHNYKFGQHRDASKIHSKVFERIFTQGIPDGCWYGCSMACAKAADKFELKTGPLKGRKVTVDGPEYETCAGLGSNIGVFDPEWIIEANFYADHYGLDTISLGTGIAFVCECYELGFLNKEITNGLELKFGAKDDIMELIHRMGRGDDEFARIVGLGIHRMKKIFAEKYGAPSDVLENIGMEGQGLEVSEYVPKESVAQWGGYFLTLKGPQHDEAWLIFMDRVNKQLPTFEDKAEALHYFPNFRLWFSLVGLCKLPWNDIEPADNAIKYKGIEAAKVPEHVQNYVDLFNAVTGKKITKEELIIQSERVYNFQRVFQLRLGRGTRKDHNIPLRAIGPVFPDEWEARSDYYDNELKAAGIDPENLSTEEKIKKLQNYRLSQWEQLVDAVYRRRGWNKNGIPTIETLRRLGIDYPEVVEVVKRHLKPEDEWES
ncbi:MAG: aldehyde:ferredoxin oxidoreductase, partial [Acetomicrobium flavidum]|uniref:aldehyde ferredoxin oxidoreductase C-terminal domain-containing protein n=1 Tax=Acetomicrobium flavidum TaxID=49896 RepID=UPI0016A9168C|nr:aldehyde:ferredoxin oxidoreductase [Acetomicrobium flavidum]